jgi:putative endonuclease
MTPSKPWFLYVLLCNDGSLYTGATNNVQKRLHRHNNVKSASAKYTWARRPVFLIAAWKLPSKSDALVAEHSFKKLSRAEKLQRVNEWGPLPDYPYDY